MWGGTRLVGCMTFILSAHQKWGVQGMGLQQQHTMVTMSGPSAHTLCQRCYPTSLFVHQSSEPRCYLTRLSVHIRVVIRDATSQGCQCIRVVIRDATSQGCQCIRVVSQDATSQGPSVHQSSEPRHYLTRLSVNQSSEPCQTHTVQRGARACMTAEERIVMYYTNTNTTKWVMDFCTGSCPVFTWITEYIAL